MMWEIINEEQPESNPIIDGGSVTFVWHGNTTPVLISDLNGWETGQVW